MQIKIEYKKKKKEMFHYASANWCLAKCPQVSLRDSFIFKQTQSGQVQLTLFEIIKAKSNLQLWYKLTDVIVDNEDWNIWWKEENETSAVKTIN